ncbi:MAG: glycerophosphodiester phosphodiesterase family protein [Marinibacterium sp.]
MSPSLPAALREVPIAHRALHDAASGRPENGVAAVRAAVDAGYGIEIDLQIAADGVALVFHDYDLDRLTRATGPVYAIPSGEATGLALTGGAGETIPTLAQVLDLVGGRVPLLIEIKDQAHRPGGAIGPLEAATAKALQGYGGPVAVMSFNPDSVAEMARLAPDIPRGLTTCAFDDAEAPSDAGLRERLREIGDFDRVGASFISHDRRDLDRPRVAALRAGGTPVLCWTIRSPEQEAAARMFADNTTFEGYCPPVPG